MNMLDISHKISSNNLNVILKIKTVSPNIFVPLSQISTSLITGHNQVKSLNISQTADTDLGFFFNWSEINITC